VSFARHSSPAPGGASYSDAVVVDAAGARWIYVAGQTPRVDPPNDLPPTVGEQSELCFRQIEAILAARDAALTDIVQITVYLTSLDDYAGFAAVRARLFGGEPPSSAAVGVSALLDDALVEIVAVAVTGRDG
jgi:enamine deaminase RidA (YjgF/YER057c/UK114 family)